MQTVTSKDGTKIAFDKVGAGPAVIFVNGAIVYRAFETFMAQFAELLGKHLRSCHMPAAKRSKVKPIWLTPKCSPQSSSNSLRNNTRQGWDGLRS